MIVYISNKS